VAVRGLERCVEGCRDRLRFGDITFDRDGVEASLTKAVLSGAVLLAGAAPENEIGSRTTAGFGHSEANSSVSAGDEDGAICKGCAGVLLGHDPMVAPDSRCDN